ncbi:MAG: aminotransferase class IV [Microbacteriaceae bacterium]
MSAAPACRRWHRGRLEPVPAGPGLAEPAGPLLAADSFLVVQGRALAVELHRERFAAAAGGGDEVAAFWSAVLAAVPRRGAWFPRVEWREPGVLLYRQRPAPVRGPSLVVATAEGDPRRHPRVKGPDLDRLLALRASVRPIGAEEAVILSPDGHVVEGATSAIVWWRGELLMGVPEGVPRVDSVTERALFTLAGALGVETHREAATPAELDGCEVWALSALGGARIVTRWLHGRSGVGPDAPALAELPGRFSLWRRRLAALRRPLD